MSIYTFGNVWKRVKYIRVHTSVQRWPWLARAASDERRRGGTPREREGTARPCHLEWSLSHPPVTELHTVRFCSKIMHGELFFEDYVYSDPLFVDDKVYIMTENKMCRAATRRLAVLHRRRSGRGSRPVQHSASSSRPASTERLIYLRKTYIHRVHSLSKSHFER